MKIVKTLKIGIIGLGAIGSELCEFISQLPTTQLKAVAEIDNTKIQQTLQNLREKPEVLSIKELVQLCDVVVEAAHKDCVKEIAEYVLKYKKDLMVMSIGGLLEHPELLEKFHKSTSHLYLPSGALGSLDALKAASLGTISKVKLITTKGREGLKDAPYVVSNKINLKGKQKTVIFKGNAREAVVGFPKNVNVAAVLSLAGIGAEKTEVEIVLDPTSSKNIHEVYVEGTFGNYSFKIENVPSPKNPRTSYMAVLSAKAMLRQITDSVRIGT